MANLTVDCGSCVARGPDCPTCVVSVLLGPTEDLEVLDADEQAALTVLADSGLVPPLRLIPGARVVRGIQEPISWQDFA